MHDFNSNRRGRTAARKMRQEIEEAAKPRVCPYHLLESQAAQCPGCRPKLSSEQVLRLSAFGLYEVRR